MRKAQVTINNPEEHGFNHNRIKEEISKIKPCIYYIMGDEIGGKDGTYHTHLYMAFKNPVRFSTLKNRFPPSHIEKAYGTHKSNIEYIRKEGRWKNTDKGATPVENTIEEWGNCPPDSNGRDVSLAILYELIKDGYSNFEILEKCSDYLFDTDKIDRVRLILKQEEYQEQIRPLEVTYVYGKTGTGKTSGIYNEYGYKNVFRITDYNHSFDTYRGEDVMVLDEFYSSNMRMSDILNYLDIYPLKLPARYSDKIACYTKVFICSNIPLEQQYRNIQEEAPETWKAFLRRIHTVKYYKGIDDVVVYNSVEEYMNRDEGFYEPSPEELKDCPFNI